MKAVINAGILSGALLSGAAVALAISAAVAVAPGISFAGGDSEKKALAECEAYAKAVAASNREGKKKIGKIDDLDYKYVRDLNLKDPWGNLYSLDAGGMKVVSAGPDGKAGTADDIFAAVENATAADGSGSVKIGGETAAKNEAKPAAEAPPAKKGRLRGEGEGYADFEAKRYEKALEYFLGRLKTGGGNYDHNYAAARCLDMLQRYDRAIDYYKKCVEIDPARAEAYEEMGTCLLIEKDYDAGLAALKKAKDIDPAKFTGYGNLGMAYKNSKEKDVDAAIECYKKAIEIDPKDKIALYNLGSALIVKNSLEDAEKYLKKAIEIDPEYPGALFNLASTYARMKKYDLAVEYYSKVIEIDPKALKAYRLRSASYRKAGKNAEADADEKKAAELSK